MLCRTYRLYRLGALLPDPLRTPGATTGQFEYAARIPHTTIAGTVFAAYVRHPDGTPAIPILDRAILLRVNERGILLAGEEVIVTNPKGTHPTTVERFRQAWIVKPTH